ncbi:MAG: hypothetical protein M3O62_13700 [Pseudomonadota bacterium]|nr:hypothetical protein [Pseudomonadota bacterium]
MLKPAPKSAKGLALTAAIGSLAGLAYPLAVSALPENPTEADTGAGIQIVREVETGKALAEYWDAQPVEYRATAEAVLNSVGGGQISRGSISGSVLSDFLVLFGGGSGAPQDLIKLRRESASIQQETVVK